MHSITANISVANAREAADFYAAAFGGDVVEFVQTGSGCAHAQVRITPHTSIYVSDTPLRQPGSQIRLSVALHDISETTALFVALSDSGEATVALHKPGWADLYGEVRDKFGVLWSVDCGQGEDVR